MCVCIFLKVLVEYLGANNDLKVDTTSSNNKGEEESNTVTNNDNKLDESELQSSNIITMQFKYILTEKSNRCKSV